MQKLKSALKLIKYLLLFVAAFSLAGSFYIKLNYDVDSFEQLLYTVKNAEGTGMDSIRGGIIIGTIATLVIFALLLVPFFTEKIKTKVFLRVKIKKKTHNIPVTYVSRKVLYSVLVFVLATAVSLNNLGVFGYLLRQSRLSSIYETYYVDPASVKLEFPEKKQNLVYIFVESLESSNVSLANGGAQVDSYIPNLEKLAQNYVNFSNREKIGGALPATGTGWTVAGMIAQMMGVNMKVDIDENEYGQYSSFMGGAVGIGEILKENGYKNYFLMGSEARFGGRDKLLQQHGDYEIFDLFAAREAGKVPEDYKEWWGYEDSKLFEYAKETVLKAVEAGEPFNVSMLTADTHFQDGYLDKTCPELFGNHYANSFHCSDSMIGKFVEWVQSQPFGNDVTIVITGDHLTMQRGFYSVGDGYERAIYNVFINSQMAVDYKETRNRRFSTMDYYPTTLAALGVKIDGERLGLGANLFSNVPTLMEELGYEKFDEELSLRSAFYNKKILGDSYEEMQQTVQRNIKQLEN